MSITYMAEKFINKDPESSLQSVVLNDPVYHEYVYVSPLSDHELASILNKCIKACPAGVLDDCVRRYTLAAFDRLTFGQYLRMNPQIVFAAAALLAILIGIIAVFTVRNRTAKLRAAQLEREIVDQKKLEEALSAAESANRAKTEFLFNMSHDIRTPMNAITGFTAMAKKHIDDRKAVSDYLGKIEMSEKQLLSLINNILEMARIESGQTELAEVPVNISQSFDVYTTALAEQAHLNGQKFVCRLEDIKHNYVFADEAKVNSIFLNIVSNAMKYTPANGSIDFCLKEIESEKPGCATFLISVEDTGIGMSKEFQKTIFDQFSREKTSTVSRIQGTGLGLSIVKRYVDLLGGDIKVRSDVGKGTRFDVTLDFRINEPAETPAEESPGACDVSLKGRRVLLVEDNEFNREIALDVLEEEGFEVEAAEDGSVAVDMMREKGPDCYDFILMDIQMPVMNGYEATKAIRELYPDKHIPIIAVSANAFEEDRKASKEAGMDDHIAKPVDVKELFGVLAKYL